tara:strand:+ start:516 stop:743 length:228 start_codon:yes stop_codon:yes gene_type:complete
MTAEEWMIEIIRGVLTPHGFIMALFALGMWLKAANMFGGWLRTKWDEKKLRDKAEPNPHDLHYQGIPEFICGDCA